MNRVLQIALFLVLLAFSNVLNAQVSFGHAEKINEQWQFYLGDAPNAQAATFDVSKWRMLDLPHDWSVEGTLSPNLASCTGYLPGGVGWYRKSLNISADKKGQKIYLYFEGVYNRSEVFINGHLLGKRPNGYISFMYDVTPYVEVGKENMVAVRVDHSQSADSRWYSGSGIYREVWMVTANPTHIAQWGVFFQTKQLSKAKAILSVETEIENGVAAKVDLQIVQKIVDAVGKEVAKSSKKMTISANSKNKIAQEVTLPNPSLWSLDKPYLYSLQTVVLQNGKTIDEATVPVGIRTFTFDANKGFALNGEWMKMKGVCLHHDAGVLGAAVPREMWKRRLQNLKNLGCNAIRMTHNPQAPVLYDLCDEMGFLVIDEAFDEWEFAKRKWLEGWNVGKPGYQGSFDFFEEWGEKDLADMVRRDRNHASVFAWSIGNEVDYPNDPYSHPVLGSKGDGGFTQPIFGGYKKDAPDATRLGVIAKRLAAVVKREDASRPVTAGLAGVVMSNATEYPSALDIAGYNYTEKMYQTDHEKYSNRVIYGSENRHDLAAWKAVLDNEHIFGQFLWTGIDYLGESRKWPSRGFYSGLLDLGGFVKPRGYFRQSLWTVKPMVYAGTYPISGNNEKTPSMDAWPVWNYNDGEMIRVVCYTNCQQAQLLLNGRQVGETKNYDDNTGILYWDLPYTAGKLEMLGLNDGKEVCRYAIKTSGRPFAIMAKLATADLSATENIAQVEVQVVDEAGLLVMLSDDEVTCDIEGAAKLLGLEASNNADMGNYRDNVQRAYHGRLIAYIQVADKSKPVKINFSAPWLKPAQIVLPAAK